jgi:prepilin-type N-terminal cleavage/methylation domain-containing protein
MNRYSVRHDRQALARRGAFTLVEILIVVIILGILASVVIAQFQNTTADSKKAALTDNLHQIRCQIQLYAIQHDVNPTLTGADWTDLTDRVTIGAKTYGPYLPSIPRNNLNNYTNVAVVATNQAFGDAVAGVEIGWVYCPSTGYIWATNRAGDKIFNEADLNDPNNN